VICQSWRPSLLLSWLLAVALVAGCASGTVDSVPSITFEGERYFAAIAPRAQITVADLTRLGDATTIDDTSSVTGLTVFGIDGVKPQDLIVMPAARPNDGSFVLFVRENLVPRPPGGASEENNDAQFVRSIAGLCLYFPSIGC